MSNPYPYSAMEMKCPVCGSNFIPAPYHIYKYQERLVCRWNCLCKARNEKMQFRTFYADTQKKVIHEDSIKEYDGLPVIKTSIRSYPDLRKIFLGKNYIRLEKADYITDCLDEHNIMQGWLRLSTPARIKHNRTSILFRGGISTEQKKSREFFIALPTHIVVEEISPNADFDIEDIRKVMTDAIVIDKRL